MINFDGIVNENKTVHNKNWPYIPDHPYRILIIGSGKTNTLLNLIGSKRVPKDVRLNTTYFFITKILSKRELQQIAINHSSDINTKDFVNIYRKCTGEPYSFFVNDTTLASDNPLRFKKNLFGIYNKNHDN